MTEQWVMRVSPMLDRLELIQQAIKNPKLPGAYLCAFDPEAHRGRGRITTTTDLAKAKRFPSFEAVMECWKTQSRTVPLRDDGKPNRPLTAFTIQPEKLDEEPP